MVDLIATSIQLSEAKNLTMSNLLFQRASTFEDAMMLRKRQASRKVTTAVYRGGDNKVCLLEVVKERSPYQ